MFCPELDGFIFQLSQFTVGRLVDADSPDMVFANQLKSLPTDGIKMDTKRITAVFLAAIMVAVAIGSILQVSNDIYATDETQSTGNVNVYFKDQSQNTNMASVTAYDLYEAVVKAGATLGYTVQTATGNDSWKTFVYSPAGSYYDINKDYGTISTITIGSNSPVSISNYSIYVYNKTTNSNLFGWNPAIDAIGWYHPYNDYSAIGTVSNVNYSLASANIAIVYGSGEPDITNMKSLTDVNRYDDNYQYSFIIQGEVSPVTINAITEGADGFESAIYTEEDILGGIFVYGWGSNAYEALKNSIGSSNVEGQASNYILHDMIDYQYYTYYSWMDEILGSQNTSEPPYHYWSTYCYNPEGDELYCDYTLGYYTTVTGNTFEHNDTFSVIYV